MTSCMHSMSLGTTLHYETLKRVPVSASKSLDSENSSQTDGAAVHAFWVSGGPDLKTKYSPGPWTAYLAKKKKKNKSKNGNIRKSSQRGYTGFVTAVNDGH